MKVPDENPGADLAPAQARGADALLVNGPGARPTGLRASSVLLSRATWFVQLRWLAVLGVFGTTFAARHVLGLGVREWPLYVIACLLLASNAYFYCWARGLRAVEQEGERVRRAKVFANAQISSDLVLLTLLLHFSGGVENPFSLFFVFHMVLASILLSALASYLQATFAVALFGGMALTEYLVPELHRPLVGFLREDVSQNGLYVLSRVLVLGATLYIAVFFTSSIAHLLHQREAELQRASAQTEELVWQLAEGNVRLMSLEEKQARFMRVAAHQLRSPLAAIDSCLKLVLDGYLVSDRDRELDMVSRAHTRAQGMLTLIGELLDLARHRDAKASPDKVRPSQVDAVVKSVLNLQAHVANERSVALEVQPGLPGIWIAAAEDKVRDAVTNLVSNAIKYTPAGGQVHVRTWRQGERAWCEVKDTGIGIPDEDQDQLFQEFFRAANAKAMASQGTGLGLVIAREIVRSYGGDIEFESKVDVGTTFRFHLPVADEPTCASASPVDAAC